MNKKQASPALSICSGKRPLVLRQELSNIKEDIELESEIKLPPPSRQLPGLPRSQTKQLRRLIGGSSNVRNSSKSTQSHNTLSNASENNSSMLCRERLPQISPLPSRHRNKSALDMILEDRSNYAKSYFLELRRAEQTTEKVIESPEDIYFEFPAVRVGDWEVRGYLRDKHLLLKGCGHNRTCIKKYEYAKVFARVKQDYRAWVQGKYALQA